jgi:hypothetical protein
MLPKAALDEPPSWFVTARLNGRFGCSVSRGSHVCFVGLREPSLGGARLAGFSICRIPRKLERSASWAETGSEGSCRAAGECNFGLRPIFDVCMVDGCSGSRDRFRPSIFSTCAAAKYFDGFLDGRAVFGRQFWDASCDLRVCFIIPRVQFLFYRAALHFSDIAAA